MKQEIFTDEFLKEIGFTLIEKRKVNLNLIQFTERQKIEQE